MNAPFLMKQPMTAEPLSPLPMFLKHLSVEITPKQIDKLALIAPHLQPGARVFIALIDPADVALQLAAAIAVKQAGLTPVPHVPARFVHDLDNLKSRIGALAEKAGATQMLVLGGGAPHPVGIYDAAIRILETGVFEANGITRVGFAGHPEGNTDITRKHGEGELFRALKEKQEWLKAAGVEGFIATQFLFEAGPVAYWADELRKAGIELPIHVGVPGPATIKTLVKYATMCGVGNSARFIRKQALNVTKLLTVSAPDDFVEQLAKLHTSRPELRIAAPHFYPFGGFDRLFEWLSPKLAA